ncbi:type IV pilus modification PilV family protein [Desulfosporosinus burensis]
MLLALFLFSLGFAVLFGLTESAVTQSRQAFTLMEGANLAQKIMDRLANHEWRDNLVQQACIPGGTVRGQEGKFQWIIRSEWDDMPQLLRVSVEVFWKGKENPSQYKLESLYAVE